MLVREAAAGDIPALKRIMNHYRRNSNFLWEKTQLTDAEVQAWLDTHTQQPYAALVAQEGDSVIGFASLSRFRPHAGYNYTAENSIYLEPGCAGKGCGGALMKALLIRARENGLRVVTAWIDEENINSIDFHKHCGFQYVGCMRQVGVLEGMPRSVVIMQYNMEE